ncbi:MAG: YceI family protein [Marinifilaceae bacterium]
MKRVFLVCLFNFLILCAFAQKEYKINIDSSRVVLKGTSTLHDWEASSMAIKGSVFALIEDGSIKDISSVEVSVKVKSLDSKSVGLAKRLHKELAYKEFPNISFKFNRLVVLKKDSVEIEGDLTIKGVTKKLKLDGNVVFKEGSGDMLFFLGSKTLKMTDFNIVPPKVLLGVIKTGNEVNVDFNIYLINKNMK